MKTLFLLLLAFSSGISQRDENRLDSLVFDFSSEMKSTLAEDGWIKMSFSVVHYNDQDLDVAFKATCLESGLDLPFYPQTDHYLLRSGEELPITIFMNEQCGQLENLPAGEHNRVIRFQFVEVGKNDTLSFEQQYVIRVE